MFDIFTGEHTDIGDTRQINQDSILSLKGRISKKSVGLFIVSDGCGGLYLGEEASKLVVTYFKRIWDTALKEMLERNRISDGAICELLEKTIFDINEIIIDFGGQVGNKVGTTLSLLLIVENKYYIKNVGDSRIYLVRKGKIEQLTEDQSLVATMIRNKELTDEEAKKFSRKNVLTMCIGTFEEVKTYTRTGKIKSGDLFLLCSDGLYNYVSDNSFNEFLVEENTENIDEIVRLLRDSIPEGNAKDNVSLILVKLKRKFWRIV